VYEEDAEHRSKNEEKKQQMSYAYGTPRPLTDYQREELKIREWK